jgi:alkanesulfonate monooxygenase SsuD/methylene tetrahydromethanopterin reductase-like flavin-dependent oxidoreductase (luciferase family)
LVVAARPRADARRAREDEMSLEIGIFDHLDSNDLTPQAFFESRLRIVEMYDRAGFYAYHCAEHHLAPIGMVPSPSVFLAAVAQRTKQLRFGPLVYVVPLYHPLRLIEEICMLDQMSGGRLQMGFGRGSSKAENRYFGDHADEMQRVYGEHLELILKSLSEGRISIPGAPESFQNMPLPVQPVQKPHPPMWYGIHAVESAEHAARRRFNTISLDPAAHTRAVSQRYREVWQDVHGGEPTTKIGISRFVVAAENDASALAIARRAYERWYANFTYTSRRHNVPQNHPRPATWDAMAERGLAVAGTPETIAAYIEAELDEAAANYFVGQFVFGDLTDDEARRSLRLFIDGVMPRVSQAARAITPSASLEPLASTDRRSF